MVPGQETLQNANYLALIIAFLSWTQRRLFKRQMFWFVTRSFHLLKGQIARQVNTAFGMGLNLIHPLPPLSLFHSPSPPLHLCRGGKYPKIPYQSYHLFFDDAFYFHFC